MNLIEITDLISLQIDDIGHLRVPLRLLTNQINSAQSYLANLIQDQEADIFMASEDLTPNSGDGVLLPKDFGRARDISIYGVPIEIILGGQRHNFEISTYDWVGGGSGLNFCYLRSGKVYFYSGLTGTVNFVYSRRLPKLHRGVPQAGTNATTVVLADPTLIGVVETSDDYYKNATIVGVSGPGAGEEQVVTGYVGSTKTATTATWAEPLTVNSIYEIKCELPEDPDFQSVLCDMVSSKLGDPKRKVRDNRDDELNMKLGQLSAINSQNPMMII